MKNRQFNRYRAGARAFFVSAALFAMLAPTSAVADPVCEIPLFVKQNMGGANVMIMADNSGSMNAATYHPAYDPTTVYTGSFRSTSDYSVGKAGNYGPRDFNWRFADAPDAALVASDNGQRGRYRGNYLNWIYYHATAEQRAAIPRQTRIQVLKSVLDRIVARSERLRFGLTIFNFDDGGRVISPIGSDHATLRSQIAGITANTWTPLGETAETILDYFSDPDGPIETACQYSFNIMITDGVPTMDLGVSGYLHDADGDGHDPGNCTSMGAGISDWYDCSDHADDVAWWMANEDLRSDLDGNQYVYTYVVGFHENAQILQDTAENGQGLYFHADSAEQLTRSIEFAVQDILRRISAGSAVAVVSTERGSDDRLYRGKFMPIDWNGFLESYTLPYTVGDAAIWEAGSILHNSNSPRSIFTGIGKNRYDFRASSAPELRAEMGVASDDEAAELINWGRGEDVDGLRDRRGWILGDIVHSTPVVVGEPRDFIIEESYQNFQAAQQNRRKMVYVGANDGMIHGFDAVNGGEVWAFVPQFALPKFAAMADSFYCHTYSCDQTVKVKDVQIGGTWRTVMVGGGGRGGYRIFALDITNPNAPELMWQKRLRNSKSFHSEPEIGSIGGTPVVIVGSGLDDGGKAFVYCYKLSSGAYQGKVKLSESSTGRNKATRPALVDRNLDGQTDLVYIADHEGSLWRFDVGNNTDPSGWDKTELYQGTDVITADPVAAFAPGGDVYVYFGTGAYLDETDMATTDQEYFICVFDNHSRSTVRKSGLANQTSSISDVTNKEGWYVSLWNQTGERVTEQAVVVAETVIFTSFSPSMDPCIAGGTSYLYQMRYDDGGLPGDDEDEDSDDRAVGLGEGIASYPVVDLTEGTVVVQSSDASITVTPIASAYQRLTVRSWQESYEHVDEVSDPSATGIN